MQRTSKTRKAAYNALSKFLPTATPCPHALVTWVTRTAKSTATYRDGNTRPDGQRGGRLVRSAARCVLAGDHPGQAHRTGDRRLWS